MKRFARREGTEAPAPRRLLAALSYGNFLGYLSMVLAPMWVEAMGHAEISGRAAGAVVAGQFAFFGLASLGTAALIARFGIRSLALAGLILSAAGDAGSYWAKGLLELGLFRILCGLGEGILLASVNAGAAATARPQRSFAVMAFVLAALSATSFIAAPTAKDTLGENGVFGIMVALRGLGLLLLLALPRAKQARESGRSGISIQPGILLSLGAYTLFTMGQMCLWPFMAELGLAEGLSLTRIADILAIGAFLILLGPVAAGWLDGKFGQVAPLLVALAATGLSALLFLLPYHLLSFGAGDIIFNTIGQFCIVYFLSLLAKQDSTNRAVAASSAFVGLGVTLGPFGGGLAISHFGVASIPLLAFGFHISAALLLTPLCRLERSTPQAAMRCDRPTGVVEMD